jgi:hypothetical protein
MLRSMGDPLTIMMIIGAGLKLVDQFRDLAIKFKGNKPTPPSGIAEQTKDEIQIRYGGKVVKEVKASELKMDQWDDARYKALQRRIKFNWDLFNEWFSQLPELSADEQSRIKLRMDRIKGELCDDFREMVGIYQRTLNTDLPDHYKLYEVCGPVPPSL